MKETGLTAGQLNLLQAVFKNYPAIKFVKLYGSRAKGTFNERSDIDLVVFGDNISRFLISDLLLELENSDLPYLVDVQNYADLKNRKLIEHIDRVGVVIYQVEKEKAVL
jgi:uncharacterized protein